jgi:leader peptidase (prepilin peptidase)/N-methyltransferase
MIEFLTAVLFLAVEIKVGVSSALFVRHWPLASIFIAVTFIDLEHRIIPDSLSLGGAILGLATSILPMEMGWQSSVLGFLFGFGVFYLLALAYYQIRGRSGIGGGDIKLLGMIGAFLGGSGVFVTILLSSVLGSLVGLAWAQLSHKKDLMKFAIPYGPFLVLGALCYYLLGDQLWFQFMIPM